MRHALATVVAVPAVAGARLVLMVRITGWVTNGCGHLVACREIGAE